MATANDVLQVFNQLSRIEQAKAAGVIQQTLPLPTRSSGYLGLLWLMVVGAFIVLLLGGTVILFLLVRNGTTTEVIAPLVTGALGVLAGLLAPSPAAGGR